MLFTSYQFLFFLICVFVLFYCLPKKFQTMVLLGASYCFYYFAAEGCLKYIIFTTVITYFCAGKISDLWEDTKGAIQEKTCDHSSKTKKEIRKKRQKRWLLLCLIMNLALLGIVKYTNFSINTINNVSDFFNLPVEIAFLDLVLPLGISFYMFQSIGYLVDVYRGKYRAEKNIIKFALFVSFFPQLIQGPISRYDEISKTLYTEKEFNMTWIASALQRILWGYFKKLVIADRILVAVNTMIQSPEEYQGVYVFLGALFYAVELYADFTGGIDITIGIAELFGIRLAENFNRPFFSKSVKEYWNRWHISMGTWFRDYVFYPVSVSKGMRRVMHFTKEHFGKEAGKKVPVYLSAFFVWFLTGLWHGAGWNFIAWGLGNFFIIVISQEMEPWYEKFHTRFPGAKSSKLFQCFQIVRTILLMSCLRMFDCYRNVPRTCYMFVTIFTKWDSAVFIDGSLLELGLGVSDYVILLVGIIFMILVSLLQRKAPVRQQIRSMTPRCRFLIWYGLFLMVVLFGAYGIGYDATQFIYNQF